jgi:NAD+ diphosphatase
MKFCPQCGNDLVSVEIDGKPRQKCPSLSCDYVFWNNPTPVVAAIVEMDDAVVLIRNKGWPEKLFGLPSGFLEQGETPEHGILREVKEELGIEGSIEDFVGYYSFFEQNQLILAFHVKGQGEITMGDELAEIKLVHIERLRPKPFGTGLALLDWLKRRKGRNGVSP